MEVWGETLFLIHWSVSLVVLQHAEWLEPELDTRWVSSLVMSNFSPTQRHHCFLSYFPSARINLLVFCLLTLSSRTCWPHAARLSALTKWVSWGTVSSTSGWQEKGFSTDCSIAFWFTYVVWPIESFSSFYDILGVTSFDIWHSEPFVICPCFACFPIHCSKTKNQQKTKQKNTKETSFRPLGGPCKSQVWFT